MPRRYTEEERRKALDNLRDCGADFNRVSSAMGIPAATLRKWKRQEDQAAQEADAEQVMAQLRVRLIENVLRLADSLEAKIDDAPLNQHASALAQLVDRLIKLAEKLPKSNQDDEVMRIEYIYPDGTTHNTPPWASDDTQL